LNKRVVLYNLGRITWMASLLLLIPVIVSFVFADGCALSFLVSAVLMFGFGFLLTLFKPKKLVSYAKEGFVTAALIWVVFSLFGAMPFVLSKSIPSYIDAFFETVSGFTTTGASVLTNVEIMPPSILFWRSFTHWVGGMGVLALAIALMPKRAGGSADNTAVHLLKAETPGPTFGKLVSKLRYNVRILYGIYTVMTVIQVVLLLLGGMPVFDSILTAFGTAGTGGFGIRNSSIAYYNSAYIDAVISIFMMLFGVNFNIYYFILAGKFLKILKSEELRWYLLIMGGATAAITVNILPMYKNGLEAVRYAFFQVSSLMTTTGYVTADYELWPVFSRIVLVLLMFVGACASSTGGGLKISRVIILVKSAFRELRHQVSPREVHVIRCDDEPQTPEVVKGVSSYFLIYMLIMLLSVLVISLDGFDPTTTATSVIACLNNIGPGLGEVGATGNYAQFSVLSKLVLSFNMLAGRLELYPLLILFSPSIWRKTV